MLVFIVFLFDDRLYGDNVENKLASSLVVALGKALIGMICSTFE